MSNDLIGRKALIENLEKWCGKQSYLIPNEVWDIIKNAPTVYDSDLIKCGIGKCRMVHKYEHPGYENNLCAGLRTLNGEGEPCETCKECLFYYGNPKWNEGECI